MIGDLIKVLMKRDRMTQKEAEDLISQAKTDLDERLEQGETPEDICEEWFGLEPDYLMDLIE